MLLLHVWGQILTVLNCQNCEEHVVLPEASEVKVTQEDQIGEIVEVMNEREQFKFNTIAIGGIWGYMYIGHNLIANS